MLYPAYGWTDKLLPDGGINALSGLQCICRPDKRSAIRQLMFAPRLIPLTLLTTVIKF
ncbi:hypothetical protein CKO_04555 [Citrobacter koseri ATCC BAA-895]|uniref:Uncharacterized protein n=1 Tax=Citrobacter koseri (strain ATCC BAA-895 / CDC 4225-83 / SGSC4696) TaxID=290338 RepID=A8AQ46_CITK8|nr:hypothetical protein CKO_04555 [Citrobacter koseri ATCC BAA-895]